MNADPLSLVQLGYGQVATYAPSEGMGVSFSVNIPEDTASSGVGPMYMQLKAPSHIQWFALGQGPKMTSGNMLVVYSASADNVTLSPRTAVGHIEPIYNPAIQAVLLDDSGIENGIMTATIRCDNCMRLNNGDHILNRRNSWIWAMKVGDPFRSDNVSHGLQQHDWHGFFSLHPKDIIGGGSENPFELPEKEVDYNDTDNQQQVSDSLLHKKRIAHGVMTSVAFVLLFPNFALTLHLIPSRWTVAWIHAPLQMFAIALAIAGAAIGYSVSEDLQEPGTYHPIIGYVAMAGVVIFQPVLGIVQHIQFRKSGKKTLYGALHRWFGRLFSALGIINGGIGFHYAPAYNPDIPPASPIVYGIISGLVGVFYVFVLYWKKYRPRFKSQKDTEVIFPATKESAATSTNTSSSTLCEKSNAVDTSKEKSQPLP